MKKILCLIDTLGIGGGAERQMVGLSQFLFEKGYELELVTYHGSKIYPKELLWQSDLKITYLRPNNSKWSKLMAIKRYIKSAGGYDWVIAYKDGPAIIGCLLKLLGGKFKLIVSERNTNQSISRRDRLKFLLYRFANYVVPNSYAQTSFIKENFPSLSRKVVTITNFTDTVHFHPVVSVLNDKKSILTVARVAAQKNVLNYLEAIKLLKQDGYSDRVHFDWYGMIQSGEEEYSKTCFAKRKELAVDDMIDFHPPTKEIVKHYQACDIFCLPSIYEGFPNVVCEAMSCGKPIVCSRVCDNPHIVQEGVNGLLFDPTDVDAIYYSLKQMIEMPKSRLLEWGANGRGIAEILFSKAAFVGKYMELIES